MNSAAITTPPTGKCNVKRFENCLFYVVVEGNQAIGYDRAESMSVTSCTHNTSLVPRPLGGRGLGTDEGNITLNLSKGIYFYLQSVSCLDAG